MLSAALDLLETATEAGTIMDLPYRWAEDDAWMARVYDENH